MDDWQRIEAEAKAQVRVEIIAAELAGLVVGQPIAWARYERGMTDRLSSVHRVGDPMGDRSMTLCGEIIPSASCRIPLVSENVVRTYGRCRYCESVLARRKDVSRDISHDNSRITVF